MTAENGEYDPKKAMKAKELFIAESAHEHELHDSHKNGTQNGSTDTPATNGNGTSNGHHHHEAFDEEPEEEMKIPAKSPKIADLPAKHSKTVDYDSLDDESEHEPQYAKIVKKDSQSQLVDTTAIDKSRSASAGSNHQEKEHHQEVPEPIKARNGTPHQEDDREIDNKSLQHSRKNSVSSGEHELNGKDTPTNASRKSSAGTATPTEDKTGKESPDSGAGSPEAGQSWSPPQPEEDDNIPLSQAPNWDLLI